MPLLGVATRERGKKATRVIADAGAAGLSRLASDRRKSSASWLSLRPAPAEGIATRDALSIEGHQAQLYNLYDCHSFVYYCRFFLDRLCTGSIQLYPVDEEGWR